MVESQPMSPDDAPPPLPPVDPAAADRLPGETVTPELLASLLADGDDDLAAWVLEQALLEDDRVTVYDGLLTDAMHLVGERWASGQWSVADEHLASQTLLRALDRVRPQPGPEWRIGPLAVLAGVAGEQHMLGLVCLSHVLTERGWTVSNLGADVPASDLVKFLARHEARLLALTASDAARLDAVAEAVSIARSVRPRVAIILGGRLASDPTVIGDLDIDAAEVTLGAATRFADERMASLSSRA
jgi:methanogenic corrinoid protein MtbC1